MKLELPGIMICEWDADTKCIIVSPAEGWKVDVNYPISEAHASLVTMQHMDAAQKMNSPDSPDYSGLEGKWLRSTCKTGNYLKDKWYKVFGVHNNLVRTKSDNGVGFSWHNPYHQFDLTDPRDYNPDEEPAPKPHNSLTLSELQEGKSYFLCKETAYMKGGERIATSGYYYEASPTFRFFASELTEGINHGTDHEFISKYFEKYVHQQKPERKPHQLQECDAVECTPEERAEIIRIADECGVPVLVFSRTSDRLSPNLFWNNEVLAGTIYTEESCPERIWHTVPDFIAKIRGEYTAVNVTEYKHESV